MNPRRRWCLGKQRSTQVEAIELGDVCGGRPEAGREEYECNEE
jgi:hypothetical protein